MREYRGKHIHAVPENAHLDGRWIYGYLCSEDYIYSPELEGEFLVDKDTVGQFTGKEDKNGTKVFEGDIVRFFMWSKGEMRMVTGSVHFEGCSYVVRRHDCNEYDAEYEIPLSKLTSGRIEVIGDIYTPVQEAVDE